MTREAAERQVKLDFDLYHARLQARLESADQKRLLQTVAKEHQEHNWYLTKDTEKQLKTYG